MNNQSVFVFTHLKKMVLLLFQQFLNETRKHYKAELESVDFEKNVEAAVLKINTWVEEQTQGTW